MKFATIFPSEPLIQECLTALPFQVATQGGKTRAELQSSHSLTWKGKKLTLDPFHEILESVPQISVSSNAFEVPKEMERSELLTLYENLSECAELIRKENLSDSEIWAYWAEVTPSGFEDGDTKASVELLETLYRDDFVVKEKKALVLDLEKSTSSYLVSVGPPRRSIIDGASQIASLALGFNDPMKNSMALRPEVMDSELNTTGWDITEAFSELLRRETKLPHVYFVNSGAEAVETALRACQTKYPDRRKIVAFEGSFHGRTFVSLHCTHSPAKRATFETYPDLVSFVPFPETKTPLQRETEPPNWFPLWEEKNDKEFEKKLTQLQAPDALLKSEIETLRQIRTKIQKEAPLAVLIEPMQGEGGDRFGTSRFFRALRTLTRAFDVALVIDEVQTGFGLGGRFFWHQFFDLPEPPDCVCSAKKAQIGICLSRFYQELDIETSAASIYRGYLHALATQETDFKKIETLLTEKLLSIQKSLGKKLVSNPRAQGLAFAFDLPSKEILGELVKKRFQNGILFYPAGEKTARFRMLLTSTPREITQMFVSIYRCFLDLAEENKIDKIPTLEEWLATESSEAQAIGKEKPHAGLDLPWKEEWIPKNKKEYLAITDQDWRKIFSACVRRCPEILRAPISLETDLETLHHSNKDDLWQHYENSVDFALLDLLWQSSRAFGFKLKRLNSEQIEKIAEDIRRLEAAVYEPERQDNPEMFAEVCRDKRSIFLAAFENEKLLGISAAAPLKHFPHIELVDTDPHRADPEALYSIDVSVAPESQGKGLGFRMKCEQLIEAVRQGATFIKSRNRYPEAKPMANLNRSLGAVVVRRNETAYGGDGLALYQSTQLCTEEPFRIHDPILPVIRNKSTLSNFVSSHYVHNLNFLRNLFPEKYRHIYLSSGRSEAVDKALKLLRFQRKTAKKALSFSDDYFGQTTAASRSMGTHGGPRFFDWPLIKGNDIESVRRTLSDADPSQFLGLFVEPLSEKSGKKKDPGFLKELLELCREKKLPVFFDETASAFCTYHPDQFFCTSGDLQPDGFFFYPGGQLGVVATTKEYFIEQPLQMISTWDGDEHSLLLLRNRILKS